MPTRDEHVEAYRLPSTLVMAARTVCESPGFTARSATKQPSKFPFSFAQVCPASVDLKRPAPKYASMLRLASPVPAYRVLSLPGSTAIAPTASDGSESKVGF